MDNKIATTVAAAQAQVIELPAFGNWRQFASLINGYAIADELCLDIGSVYSEQVEHWKQTGEWDLDILHLRLVLYFAYRSDYFTGYKYTEHDDLVDSLLYQLSQQLGLPYSGKPDDEE